MKRLLIVFCAVMFALPLTGVPTTIARADPGVTVILLNPPSSGQLELAPGESYTFNIQIKSDEPFVMAMALPNAYYPGRGVFWHGSDEATRNTSEVLHLTVTGKSSTASLVAVCDWPEVGICWPQGVAPLTIVAGVRYKGGQVSSETFTFAVKVP